LGFPSAGEFDGVDEDTPLPVDPKVKPLFE
jgi:hypothetical protein